MMKKAISFVLAFTLLLSGCGFNHQTEYKNTVRFYYKTAGLSELAGSSSIEAEVRSVTPFSLASLLNTYFSGPEDESFESPFPPGTRVMDIEENSNQIILTMSTAYFALQGIDLSIADCCLVNTICDYTGVSTVILVDETNQIRLELTPESYVTDRTGGDDTASSYTLYFSNQQDTFLTAETLNVSIGDNESTEEFLIRQLIAGPRFGTAHSDIPDGTELLSAETQDGVCTVDFSADFMENRQDNDYQNFLALYSIVNTLTVLDEVSEVQILIEGEHVDKYGIFPLSQPLTRYGAVIESVSSNTEITTDVYLRNSESGEIFTVKASAGGAGRVSVAETILRTLLSYEPPQGFETVIPYGTDLLSVSVSGETCFIDLSRDFIPQNDTADAEYYELYAIVDAMTGLDGITGVQLTIEEETGGLSYFSLEERITEKDLQMPS